MLQNFSLGMMPALAGMLMDAGTARDADVVTVIAGAVIPFGVMLEYKSDGTVQPVQQTGWPPAAPTGLAGISILDPFVEQAYVPYVVPFTGAGPSALGFPKGTALSVLKRGRIWMAYDGGGTPPRFGAFNIWHSSTGANPQGVATLTATATTAGAEIGAAPATMAVYDPGLLSKVYTDAFNNQQGILGVTINIF